MPSDVSHSSRHTAMKPAVRNGACRLRFSLLTHILTKTWPGSNDVIARVFGQDNNFMESGF